jgi:hypothetical protein
LSINYHLLYDKIKTENSDQFLWGEKMKSKLFLIMGIVVLSNLLTFTIVKFYFPASINHFLLKMKGQGEHWVISDYQIAWISGKEWVSGSETVTYLGNTNDLTGEITIEIYDYFKDGSVPHLTYTKLANSLRNGSFETGGGNAYPPKDLSLEDIVSKTKFLVRWTTIDGMVHEETIKTELDYSPTIIAEFYSIYNQK